MSTMWFDKKPGQTALSSDQEPAVLLVDPNCRPDWVRLPAELGGERVPVLDAFMAPCPLCQDNVRHLKLDALHSDGRDICVAECLSHGFVWYVA